MAADDIAGRGDVQPYRRPRAWERAKAALGPGSAREALVRLERSADTCPRVLLAAAVHRFLAMDEAGRDGAVLSYLRSLTPPAAEMLPPAEADQVEADFWAVMAQSFDLARE